jgi:2-polyprenyl-3-methyl-5-hydroxy-6-metoxy-1,4-benzoquinol methylase
MTVNKDRVHDIVMRVVNDQAGAMAMALGYLGDKLGLFRCLYESGAMTSEELASQTGLNERYVREWLRAMVASEYVEFDERTESYHLDPEQSLVLADEESPTFLGGAFQMAMPTLYNVPRILDAFRRGGGVPYDEMGSDMCCAMARFFRPGYRHELVESWLPAIPGLVERLEAGMDVLDVGCGSGQSTVRLAQAFPKSRIVGLDYHGDSIAGAIKLAHDEGLDNVEFIQAAADQIDRGRKYQLVCSFDCIHDMVKPVETLRAIREVLADDGVYLWSEPNASHLAHENRNPFGRLFHAVSPLNCLTVSLAHDGAGLGTVIGEEGARALASAAGFSSFERLSIQNPVNQFFCLRK